MHQVITQVRSGGVKRLPLKQACVLAAREIITQKGTAALNLRELARQLGVSHQAPYRHYPTRDDLLAEVLRQCFEEFAHALKQRVMHVEPQDELGSLGDAYLAYAAACPVEYALMFSDSWPQAAKHPEMAAAAKVAYDELRGVLRRIYAQLPSNLQEAWVERDAMTIWAAMHGLAGLSRLDAQSAIGLASPVQLRAHVFGMIERSMSVAQMQQLKQTTEGYQAVKASLEQI